MLSIYKKELRSYFTGLTGYVAIALILLLTGIPIRNIAFVAKNMAIENVLPSAAFILLIAIPIITMSSFAGERAQKTDTLLYSLPLSTSRIVLGKYFSMMTVFAIPVAVISLVPVVLSMYGEVDWFAFYTSVIMFFLLISAMTAICMFMSSLCESQVIAAVLGSGALFVCFLATMLVSVIPKTELAAFISFLVISALIGLIAYGFTKNLYIALSVGAVLMAVVSIVYMNDKSFFLDIFGKTVDLVAIFDRFTISVVSKVFDVKTAVYYISVAIFFNVLTVQTVEKRRYS
ncbi:MAG: ABC transporter [Ruminococcaceae bacterium]|nr:ABC transporter [Oscillospiraceae bacterium]